MLSILIPTYNYNVLPLVEQLHVLCTQSGINFEIRVLDDATPNPKDSLALINSLPHCSYRILPQNIGRSAIRNLLAKEAQYENLLFLDADTKVCKSNFIELYLNEIANNSVAVNGGILYQHTQPHPDFILRWKYGQIREALSANQRNKHPYRAFLSLNFLIKKSAFEKVKFDESLPNLRHEDTVFSYQLQQNHIRVKHIENPVWHLGLDSFEKAIVKENESLQALKLLIENEVLPKDYIKLGRAYCWLKKMKLAKFVGNLALKYEPQILKNLSSETPSLRIFDFYRLGYLCRL